MKTKKGSIESSILEVWKTAAEQTDAEKLHRPSYEIGTDEYANYTKNITPGQEVTQKLQDEGTLPPALQKAIDAKKKKGGDDEKEQDEGSLPPWLKGKGKKKGGDDDEDDKKSSKKGNMPPWLKGKDKKEALSPKQKELDVDKDGDIEADDLADLRNKKKKSESYRARESWMEAIKKVSEYSKDKKEEEEEAKGKKTMTGGKKAEVDVNPDIEEQDKRKIDVGYKY